MPAMTPGTNHLPHPESGVELHRGDITRIPVDAMVNAANSTLLGGGGVDGAIHRAAGPELLAECRTLGGCPPGEVRVTGAYRLPARWVIHAVGPVWEGGTRGEAQVLARCYRESFRAAQRLGARTVSFPSISTGAYGYPSGRAASVAVSTLRQALREDGRFPITVLLVAYDAVGEAALARALSEEG